jgi:hypothetical protein
VFRRLFRFSFRPFVRLAIGPSSFLRRHKLYPLAPRTGLALMVLLAACASPEGEESGAADSATASGERVRGYGGATLFERLQPDATGVDFINRVEEGPSINYFNYGYIYNGGGVAVLDYDQDGLADLYFSGTMVPNRLYRNKGDFQFEDVTQAAGVAAGRGFKTGVVANGDGWPDLYACRTGNGPLEERSNLLYINNKDGSFTEQAVQYGLGQPGNTNHAVFFDMDMDGDLDCYELNHPIRFGANTRPRLRGGERYTLPETAPTPGPACAAANATPCRKRPKNQTDCSETMAGDLRTSASRPASSTPPLA